jgi:hypothetical protein
VERHVVEGKEGEEYARVTWGRFSSLGGSECVMRRMPYRLCWARGGICSPYVVRSG